MKDFEVCEIGTIREIQLSRALARAIDSELEQYGNVVPHSVLQAYLKLKDHYARQIESGVL
jgi:hypothetical protein